MLENQKVTRCLPFFFSFFPFSLHCGYKLDFLLHIYIFLFFFSSLGDHEESSYTPSRILSQDYFLQRLHNYLHEARLGAMK